ncbi:FUSC family protein, partial [Klebsiella pneumoniae]|uniref:FUSC family protein n=1 Tax=Klebsiella pneumoniae TaxID=573 RepID=UPI001BAD03EC
MSGVRFPSPAPIPSTDTPSGRLGFFFFSSQRKRLSGRWLNSYERYRHRRLIHAVRLGGAVLFATALARLLHLQHGEWIGMTVFVVLGMLQFQGAIYSKAVERMLGTVIGLG